MKRMDFYLLLKPVTDKLYRMAFCLIPDDLQAEQLVIDSLNAYLIKDKKHILAMAEYETLSKKDILIKRRSSFKGVLKYMGEIGVRRASQLKDQLNSSRPVEFQKFYSLEPKVRLVFTLRYDFQFTVDEIEDIVGMPRYEVIEKIHNGRFLLMNDINVGVSL
jgi:hypothetical protein